MCLYVIVWLFFFCCGQAMNAINNICPYISGGGTATGGANELNRLVYVCIKFFLLIVTCFFFLVKYVFAAACFVALQSARVSLVPAPRRRLPPTISCSITPRRRASRNSMARTCIDSVTWERSIPCMPTRCTRASRRLCQIFVGCWTMHRCLTRPST